MTLAVSDVLDAAEAARQRGAVLLCAELLRLAEQELAAVDHHGTELSRLAIQAIEDRVPIGAVVSDAIDRAASAELRHVLLEGSNNR